MDKVFLISVTSFFVCLILIPITIRIFRTINLLDTPDNRKLHSVETPSMGGIPIFVGIFITTIAWMSLVDLIAYRYVLAAVFLIFMLGVRDDVVMLRARHKLVAQIAICSIIILFADIRFNSLYGIFGVYDLPYWASYVFSLFTLIVITNSYNLIDGIDGLAGSLGILVLSFFGYWYFISGNHTLALLSFAFVGSILAFLYFNWEPSRIFMGDTGSMLIGFFIAILTINFIDTNYSLPTGTSYKFPAHISISVGLLIIPLFDTIRVFTIRLLKKSSPMVPDRRHIHHLLIQLGMSHSKATIMLIATNVFFIILAYYTQSLGNSVSMILILTAALTLSFVLTRIHRAYGINEEKEVEERNKQIFLSKSA